MADRKSITPSVEEFLETICRITGREGEATTSVLAQRLGVSQASVSQMARRLVKRGLVQAAPYRPITLTAQGRAIAEAILRKHRLAERLLTDVLGLDWAEAHDEACLLEHAVSDEVEDKMLALLGDPEHCPHGNPIGAQRADDRAAPLSEVAAGRTAEIVRIADERGDLLRYLAVLGLLPGVRVRVANRAPFRGPLIVAVGDAEYALGREVCERIWVLAEPGATPHRRSRRRGGRP